MTDEPLTTTQLRQIAAFLSEHGLITAALPVPVVDDREERVAKAIYGSCCPDDMPWEDLSEWLRDQWLKDGRAAIAAMPEPVPEPVREWGVRHGDDCRLRSLRGGSFKRSSEADARRAFAVLNNGGCTASVVSRVPGGEWEPAK